MLLCNQFLYISSHKRKLKCLWNKKKGKETIRRPYLILSSAGTLTARRAQTLELIKRTRYTAIAASLSHSVRRPFAIRDPKLRGS